MSANGKQQRMEGHRVRECLSLGSGLEQPFLSLGTSTTKSLGSSLEHPHLETTAARRRIFLSTCSLNSFSSGSASPTRRKISLSLCSLNSNLDMLELDGSRSWRRSSELAGVSGSWAGSGKKWKHFILSCSLIPPPGSWQRRRRVESDSIEETPGNEQREKDKES